MSSLTLLDVDVLIGNTPVLSRLNVAVPPGSFVAVVGPSGVGKSTLLRALAGLVPIRNGSMLLGSIDVTKSMPADRDVAMVFQDPALLPGRTVERNVGFPLELRRRTAAEIRDRVGAEVRALHLEHVLHASPGELSRGEQQLVQIARSLVRVPRLLLLDEPFAALDERRRQSLRAEIALLQRGYGVTTVMATNDPADVDALADVVVVLGGQPATVTQVGAPDVVRDDPVHIDVARTIAPLSTVSATVTSDGDGFWLVAGSALRHRVWSPALQEYVGASVTVGVRSGGLVRADRGEALAVLERIVPGSEYPLACRLGECRVMATGAARTDEVGSAITLRVDAALVFDPDTGRRIC